MIGGVKFQEKDRMLRFADDIVPLTVNDAGVNGRHPQYPVQYEINKANPKSLS